LTVQQKIVLAPISDDWDSLEYYRQKKWLSIVTRFPSMAPEEQRRIQGQMQEWDKLSAEQRQQARQNFKTASQLPDEKKQEFKKKWAEYVNLPDDEKEKFKQQAASKPVPKSGRPAASTTTVLPLPPIPAPVPATAQPNAESAQPAAVPMAAETPPKP
jgi:hypothetical protein